MTKIIIKNSTIRPVGIFLTPGGAVSAVPARGELEADVDDAVLEQLKTLSAQGQLGVTVVSERVEAMKKLGAGARASQAGSTKKGDGSSAPTAGE